MTHQKYIAPGAVIYHFSKFLTYPYSIVCELNNYPYNVGNFEVIINLGRKTSEMILSQKGTMMVKDGKDWEGLQTMNLE